jgi:AP-1 complex subunit gamma-1
MKIASKYPSTEPVALAVFDTNATSLDCELQQRAYEYSTLLNTFRQVAEFSFAQMPPIAVSEGGEAQSSSAATAAAANMVAPAAPASLTPVAPSRNVIDDLFDLTSPSPAVHAPVGGVPAAAPPRKDVPEDIFSAVQVPLSAPPAAFEQPFMDAFRCEDLAVAIRPTRNGTTIAVEANIRCVAAPLSGLSFHVAVPRTCSVVVDPLPGTQINAGQTMVQKLTVNAANDPGLGKALMLRIKLVYTVSSVTKEQMFQFAHAF